MGLQLTTPCRYSCGDVYIGTRNCEALNEDVVGYNPELSACCSCRAQWSWTDESAMNFLNWDPFKPQNTDLMCGYADAAYGYAWNDVSCEETAGFICAKGTSNFTPESQDNSMEENRTPPNENQSSEAGNMEGTKSKEGNKLLQKFKP